MSTSITSPAKVDNDAAPSRDMTALTMEAENTSLGVDSITDGSNGRGIPKVKFVEDIGDFAETFDPPASTEILIGAFSDLYAKYKSSENMLIQKSE
jgi:hypothetical protein